MDSKIDSRKRRTRNYLRSALAKLLHEKDIAMISVNELITTAQISRGTFYLHYSDLNDFINTLINETLTDMFHKINAVTKLDDDQTFVTRNIVLLEYIAKDAEFFAGMLGENGPKEFQNRWRELAVEHFQQKYHSLALKDPRYMLMLLHKDIFGAYNIAAQMETIKFWLLGGMQYSPAFLAKILAEIRSSTIQVILNTLNNK